MELQRFAFSTHTYSRHSLQHALNHIADAGFKSVEILADKPHAWMDTLTPTDQVRLIKQLFKRGFAVSSVNANRTTGFWSDAPAEPIFEPSLVSHSREFREWRIAYTKKALRLGKAIGAKSVSITSGRTLPGVPPEKAQKFLVEGLQRLLEYAETIGQRLALTCEPTLLIEKTGELAELIRVLGSQFFGANLDIAALQIAGEDPSAAIAKLKGHIFNVELADIRAHKNYRRVPGAGEINFTAIFKALHGAGYNGPLTWNLAIDDELPDAACKKTFKFCKSIRAK